MIELIKAESGAKRVVVFDHTLRTADDELREAKKIREVVRRAHNDYTEWSGPQRVRDILPDEAEDLLTRRFAIIQVWRPIRHPVETFPLAICDARSVAFEDFIISERLYPGRKGQTYACAYNPKHHWYWFPRMRREEALVFKVYDSQKEGVARWTAHTAFEDPDHAAQRAPAREHRDPDAGVFLTGTPCPHCRHRLRRPSGGAESRGAAAALRRLLAQLASIERGIPGFETNSYPPRAPLSVRQDWRGKNGGAATDVAQLTAQVLDRLGAAHGHPQLPLRRAAALQRGHGRRGRARGQRLHRQGMARPRSAAARLHRDPDPEHRIRRRRGRARRPGQALRADQARHHAGDAARAPALVAAVRRGGEARPADRHPSRARPTGSR